MSGFLPALKLFPDFDRLLLNELMVWAPEGTAAEALDNYFANRLVYPRVVAVDQRSALWDRILLKAVIARHKNSFYNPNTKRLQIPKELSELFPDLTHLAEMFLDICHPEGITYVSFKPNITIGTIITPRLTKAKGTIVIVAAGQRYELEIGTLGRLIVVDRKVDLKFTSLGATLMNQADFQIEVAGGPLGILVDARL